jgi:hypothetical protein
MADKGSGRLSRPEVRAEMPGDRRTPRGRAERNLCVIKPKPALTRGMMFDSPATFFMPTERQPRVTRENPKEDSAGIGEAVRPRASVNATRRS